MREIKFRAWNASERKMTTPFAWVNECSLFSTCMCSAPTHELMQFTGMHDKNGVPIYEGDILSSPHFDNNRLTHSVLWSDKYNGWFLHNLSSSEIYGDGSVQMWVAMKHGPYEVIGNIHQHAHLLEQNKC